MKKKEEIKLETRKTRLKIGFPKNPKTWKKAKPYITKHVLKIIGHPVMEDWERTYMKTLASIVTKKGGLILEVGYGLGISAKFIDQHKIQQHIIIEANHTIANKARAFAKKARHQTIVLEGFWEEVIKQIKDNNLDGILFDTYPMSALEIHRNHYCFFKVAKKKLKNGGIFTYYSDEVENFSYDHFSRLLKAGFQRKNILGKIIKVYPPKNCLYWRYRTILAPTIIK